MSFDWIAHSKLLSGPGVCDFVVTYLDERLKSHNAVQSNRKLNYYPMRSFHNDNIPDIKLGMIDYIIKQLYSNLFL